jgi:hypothetical protein
MAAVKARICQSKPAWRARIADELASMAWGWRCGRVAEGQAGCSAERGEQEAFGEHLAEDVAAARAEGKAGAHFALAGGGAGEQQVGEVDAGEEQDQAGEREEDVGGLGELSVEGVGAAAAGLEAEMEAFHGFGEGTTDCAAGRKARSS